MTLGGAATPDSAPWHGRKHANGTGSRVRSSYEVDRDRIIHCGTFRELQHKTQVQSVISAPSGGTFRTRLNHVIEVAQLARGIARELRAGEALAEAIALAHDLGHPPFGHAGERALRDALAEHGSEGWNANVHSLDVVDDVEAMFVGFRGLNLSWATREGIARHSTPFDEPVSFGEFAETPYGGLECQIVDAADVLAYLSHDLDDALAHGYIELTDVAVTSPILMELIESAESAWHERGRHIWPDEERNALIRRSVVARLINRSIIDIAQETRARVALFALESPSAVRAASERAVTQSDDYENLTRSLLHLLLTRYYRSEVVRDADERAERLVRGLFEALLEAPAEIPERFKRQDPAVSVATYLASLNDRSASALATKLGVANDRSSRVPQRTPE